MQELTSQQKLKPWMGFVLFAVLMVFMLFGNGRMQSAWGLAGLVASEAVFLILAIAYALIFRIPLKEMFPIRKFKAGDFFGSLFLTAGGFLFGLISIALTGMLYPKSLEGSDVRALNSYLGNGSGYIFTVFTMAVTPAICEEAIHRGAILANFRSFKKNWVAVLIMGVFFGIFHLSSLRFINTAIMGACLTYIVIKKNNILLSSLMHFLINFGSVTLSFVVNNTSGVSANEAGASAQMTGDSMKAALGSYLMLGITAPFLIVIGLMFLDRASHKKIRFLFAGIVSVIMLIGSIAVTVSNNTGKNVIVRANLSYMVEAEETDSDSVGFDVESNGNYAVAVVIMNAEGDYSVRIEKDNGEYISGGPVSSGAIKMYSENTALEAGSYKLFIINGAGTRGGKPVVSVQINKT